MDEQVDSLRRWLHEAEAEGDAAETRRIREYLANKHHMRRLELEYDASYAHALACIAMENGDTAAAAEHMVTWERRLRRASEDVVEAARYFRDVLDAPGDSETENRCLLADELVELGRPKDAVTVLRPVAKARPVDVCVPRLMAKAGDALFSAGDVPTARTAYKTAFRLAERYPVWAPCVVNRVGEGDEDRVIAVFHGGGCWVGPYALYRLAWCDLARAEKREHYEVALKGFGDAMRNARRAPGFRDVGVVLIREFVLRDLTYAYARVRRAAGARTYLERVGGKYENKEPHVLGALRHLAKVYEEMGRAEDAERVRAQLDANAD